MTARYVMMHSNHRKTQYGVSLWELEVYGDSDVACAGCADRPLALDLAGSSPGWTNLAGATDGVAGPGATASTKATTGTEYVEYWLTGGILVYAVNACGAVSPASDTNGVAFVFE